jgi:hypothetical protein
MCDASFVTIMYRRLMMQRKSKLFPTNLLGVKKLSPWNARKWYVPICNVDQMSIF